MTRGVFNWTFDDVVRFLRDHGFTLNHVEGSHYYYTGVVDGKLRQVSVHFHAGKSIKPRTFKSMINQSGIPKKEWME